MATLDQDDLNAIALLLTNSALAKEATLVNTTAWVKSSAFNNMIGASEWSPSAIEAAFSVEIPAGTVINLRMRQIDSATGNFNALVLGEFNFQAASLTTTLAISEEWTAAGASSGEAVFCEIIAPQGATFPACTMSLVGYMNVHLPVVVATNSITINGWTTDGHWAIMPSDLAPKAMENISDSIESKVDELLWQTASNWMMLESPEPTYDNNKGLKIISFSGVLGAGGMSVSAISLMYGGFRYPNGGWVGQSDLGVINQDLSFTPAGSPVWPSINGNPGGILFIAPSNGTTGGVMVIEYINSYQEAPIQLTFYVPTIGATDTMDYYITADGNPRPRCGFGPGAAMGNPMDRIREAVTIQMVTDIHDDVMGKWVVNLTNNTLTKYRADGVTVLEQFALTAETDKTTAKLYTARTPI